METKLIGICEFAKLAGKSRQTFRTWLKAGKLPPPSVIGGVRYWTLETAEAWLRGGK